MKTLQNIIDETKNSELYKLKMKLKALLEDEDVIENLSFASLYLVNPDEITTEFDDIVITFKRYVGWFENETTLILTIDLLDDGFIELELLKNITYKVEYNFKIKGNTLKDNAEIYNKAFQSIETFLNPA